MMIYHGMLAIMSWGGGFGEYILILKMALGFGKPPFCRGVKLNSNGHVGVHVELDEIC